MAEWALSFSIASVSTSAVAITVHNSSSSVPYGFFLYCETYGGSDTHTVGSQSGTVAAGGNFTTGFSNLWYATYRVRCYQDGVHVQTLYFTISAGGGTSGGGGTGGSSCSSTLQSKTNSVSWNTSTAAGTSYLNSAGSYGSGTLSCQGSGWTGESWVWARLDSVVETDIDVTYTITQGARTHNIADWPYHGITITYKDEDNTTQTFYKLEPTSSGYYWANASNESGYNYQVNAPFVNTIKLTYKKSLSAAYTRVLSIKFYNSKSYSCSLGCMYHWENTLNITLSVPKRTKYIAGVRSANGGSATVNNTSPEVYVNSGTSVTYRATVDANYPEVTFRGWYLPKDCTFDERLGYTVKNVGVSAVSTNPTYSKSITSDYELIAIFNGFREVGDWGTASATNTWVKVSGTWTRVQPYIRQSNAWKKAYTQVG